MGLPKTTLQGSLGALVQMRKYKARCGYWWERKGPVTGSLSSVLLALEHSRAPQNRAKQG